jgi:hypothetical protein
MRRSGLLAWLTGALFATTAAAAPGDPPSYSEVFNKAFVEGFSVETSDTLDDGTKRVQQVPFKTFEIGKLKIKSGRICAVDPFVALSVAKPFIQEVPNGYFPVRLAVGFHPAGEVKDNRVAFARVDFSSNVVVRWSQALIDGQNLSALKPNENFGYGVDAGTGSFFDPAASAEAKALLDIDNNAWEAWQTEGEANGPKVIGPYAFVLMLPLGDVNVAMFNSGWGDGFYTSWFGFDADGNVAALLTDFNTIEWETAKW